MNQKETWLYIKLVGTKKYSLNIFRLIYVFMLKILHILRSHYSHHCFEKLKKTLQDVTKIRIKPRQFILLGNQSFLNLYELMRPDRAWKQKLGRNCEQTCERSRKELQKNLWMKPMKKLGMEWEGTYRRNWFPQKKLFKKKNP